MRINTSRKSGFTLVEIMIVVAIIGLLAAIAIPNFIQARRRAQANACINNLRQIDGAKQQWALENNQAPAATVASTELQKYLGRGAQGQWPSCPTGNGTYTIGTVAEAPTCTTYDNDSTMPHKLSGGS
jgi:prepilin-type N-terminal cleavage/methylation domain-containing protein